MVNYLVSVVIVNYNSEELIIKCLNQILSSTVPVKIFVSDNASTDNSVQLIENYFKNNPHILIYKNNKNLGFSAGNNRVYPYITTPYILYLNPDCIIQNDSIENFIKTMEKFPDAGVVGCLVTNSDGTEQIGCRGVTPTPLRVFNQIFRISKYFSNSSKCFGYIFSNIEIPLEPIEVELISGSCMFVRKIAIDNVGLLDENYFLYCEDYDWFYRFIDGNWKIIFNPSIKVMHTKSYSTKHIPLKVIWYKSRGMWRYYNKFFKSNSNQAITLLVLLGIISRFLILTSAEILKKFMKIISKSITKRLGLIS